MRRATRASTNPSVDMDAAAVAASVADFASPGRAFDFEVAAGLHVLNVRGERVPLPELYAAAGGGGAPGGAAPPPPHLPRTAIVVLLRNLL